MAKITEHTYENELGEVKITICIDDENGNLTWIAKEIYDEQQAAMPKQEWVEPQLTK